MWFRGQQCLMGAGADGRAGCGPELPGSTANAVSSTAGEEAVPRWVGHEEKRSEHHQDRPSAGQARAGRSDPDGKVISGHTSEIPAIGRLKRPCGNSRPVYSAGR